MLRHYPFLLDPREYPDYTRRPHRVPTWETFDHTPQLTTLRAFSEQDGRLIDWHEDLDLYTEKLRLGRVIWPVFHTMFASNFKDLVQEIKRRGLYLFDFWGHVPGSGMEGMWSHVMPPPGLVEHMQRELGDHFLGIDNGEQDGRYVGGYASQQCPSFAGRFRQYLNFQRHFERMCDDLGNHMTTLVSLSFGHYFLKEGNHVLIGAETAQALPNSQVYYAFIRGAGKQYGVHWFGNASVFNRWGYKTYESESAGSGEEGAESSFGPERGTSLSLLKRLLYTHYLYNSVCVGFEQSWVRGDNVEHRLDGIPVQMELNPSACRLTPVGVIQAKAGEFIEQHGQPGVMHAPVALLLDFFAGWTVPRHLYVGQVFQVWGSAPYEAGDYLTHGVLSLLYPGYEDASYYRDERGFLTPTPYGDMADCLLSDCPAWVLGQYGLAIAAGALTIDREIQDRLQAFVAEGGQLVVTGANARGLVPGFVVEHEATLMPAGSVVLWSDGTQVEEPRAFEILPATVPAGAEIEATCAGRPLVVRIPTGRGFYTVLLSPYGLNAEPLTNGPVVNKDHTSLDCPYLLLEHVRRTFGAALTSQQLFSVSDGLGLITCRKGAGDYTLCVHNNGLDPRQMRIDSLCGPITSMVELPLDQAEKREPGYWPEGYSDNDGGVSDGGAIAGGDVRLFAVRVDERDVACLPRSVPPERPRNRMLSLRGDGSIQEQILARPTFFQHFDGVKVDSTYFRQRDRSELSRSAGWLGRQQVRVIADFSHSLNFYPNLTLLDTLTWRYDESLVAIEEGFDKMALLNAQDAVICLHRRPENHCDDARADDRFLSGVRKLCVQAESRGIALHLQHHLSKWHGSAAGMLRFIAAVQAPNLRFALNTGHLPMTSEGLGETLALAGNRLGSILLCAPVVDGIGQLYDAHAPVHHSGNDLSLLRDWSHVPQMLDGDYACWDEEYLDCLAAWGG